MTVIRPADPQAFPLWVLPLALPGPLVALPCLGAPLLRKPDDRRYRLGSASASERVRPRVPQISSQRSPAHRLRHLYWQPSEAATQRTRPHGRRPSETRSKGIVLLDYLPCPPFLRSSLRVSHPSPRLLSRSIFPAAPLFASSGPPLADRPTPPLLCAFPRDQATVSSPTPQPIARPLGLPSGLATQGQHRRPGTTSRRAASIRDTRDRDQQLPSGVTRRLHARRSGPTSTVRVTSGPLLRTHRAPGLSYNARLGTHRAERRACGRSDAGPEPDHRQSRNGSRSVDVGTVRQTDRANSRIARRDPRSPTPAGTPNGSRRRRTGPVPTVRAGVRPALSKALLSKRILSLTPLLPPRLPVGPPPSASGRPRGAGIHFEREPGRRQPHWTAHPRPASKCRQDAAASG